MVAYIYLIGALYLTATMNLGIDAFIVGLMSMANAQIKILGVRVSTLSRRTNVDSKMDRDSAIYNNLKECVRQHVRILR